MTPAVCLLQNKVPLNEEIFRFLLQFSTLERRQRILRQRNKQNADSMVIGGALLRYMLWNEFRVPMDVKISIGEFGKPYLPDYSSVHFIISHSGKFVACAVYNKQIGIDIQKITPYRSDIAFRTCSNSELLQIKSSYDKSTEFTKIWTVKEAYLKMLGLGIVQGLKTIEYPPYLHVNTTKYQDIFVSIVEAL